MISPPPHEQTVQQLLDRLTELEAMAATATTPAAKTALETLIARVLALADKRAAELSGRGRRKGGAAKSAEQGPGEPALRAGRFRLFNVFGSATGETISAMRGQKLPAAPRGYSWRLEELPLVLFGPAFEATPHAYLLLTPDLKIAGANDAYLAATLTRRSDILGCFVFDVFPDNPNDAKADGVVKLSTSLARVLDQGSTDTMDIQRYDIRGPDGRFQERWWRPVNIPVFDSARLVHVLHYVEDVTAQRRSGQPA